MSPTYCDKCVDTPVCDFCTHFDFNGEEEDGIVFYVDKGWCRKHERDADPGSGCDDFVCGMPSEVASGGPRR